MKSHGELGKTYLDVLSEFTTGGCGLDDWEWGITIFSNDDIQFKKIVYDMRFEVASAKYGIFSDFYVGTIIDDALTRRNLWIIKEPAPSRLFLLFNSYI